MLQGKLATVTDCLGIFTRLVITSSAGGERPLTSAPRRWAAVYYADEKPIGNPGQTRFDPSAPDR